MNWDTDVVVIGSGFGGSAAALRLSEAGQQVVVLERGDWIRREDFEVSPDAVFAPRQHRFGMNQFRRLGRHIVAWLGAGVGGGSHVYAATLKRRHGFSEFPRELQESGLDPWYERAEAMLDATPYPDYPPYSTIPAVQLMLDAEARVAAAHPERVEDFGRINLGLSFAPDGGQPGALFTNRHGIEQRYENPVEQKLLGGDIEAKNSLDKNYLALAQRLGTEIRPLCLAERIEPLAEGGYQISYRHYQPETGSGGRLLKKWFHWASSTATTEHTITCRRLIIAAGAIGSTEILLRNKHQHGTLPKLSDALGQRYSSNGDFVSLMLPRRGLVLSWVGLLAAVAGLAGAGMSTTLFGAVLYAAGLWRSRGRVDPDIGTTNSDYIRFRHRDGSPQGVYIEGGRYPRPDRLFLAALMSTTGTWKPSRYRHIIRVTRWLQRFVPPFELFARSWPVALLMMGRDDACGRLHLDQRNRLTITFPLADNDEYYRDLDQLGRWVAEAADAWYIPNLVASWTRVIEVPHNLGGVPMGDGPGTGVVDACGRVFGYDDLVVLDGSVIPTALGPNPSLTILAVAERALDRITQQLADEDRIRAAQPLGSRT